MKRVFILLLLFGCQPYRFDVVKSEEIDFPVLEIKTKHLSELEYLKDKALERGFLLPKHKIRFPVKVNGIKGKIMLKGYWNDHRCKSGKWSFRVKLKKPVFGMRDFSIQHPDCRNGIWEYLIHETLKAEGFKTIPYGFTRVVLNGSDRGLFAFEGRFKGVAPVVGRLKGNGPLENKIPFVYDKKRIPPEKAIQMQWLLEDFRDRAYTASELFALENGKLIAIHRLFGSLHALGIWNLRFYLENGLLKPISYDCLGGLYLDKRVLRQETKRKDNFQGFILRDPILRAEYIKHAKRISEPKYLQNLIKKNAPKLVQLLFNLRQEFSPPSIAPHPNVVKCFPNGSESEYFNSHLNFGPLIHNQLVMRGEIVP